jgi:hypothetical protein
MVEVLFCSVIEKRSDRWRLRLPGIGEPGFDFAHAGSCLDQGGIILSRMLSAIELMDGVIDAMANGKPPFVASWSFVQGHGIFFASSIP